MRLSSLVLAPAIVAVAIVSVQLQAAAPGGARGGGPPAISTSSPGFPGVAMPDPAVGRKAKWPIQDSVNTPPEGYTPRSPQNNGFYRRDAQGNVLLGTDLYIWEQSGHFTNYDESDIPPYTLPDPLVMQDGRRVTSAEMWYKERRPELVNLFKDNIYGRVPEEKLPKMIWEVRSNEKSTDGRTINKTIVGYFEGTTPDAGAGGGGFGGGRGARGPTTAPAARGAIGAGPTTAPAGGRAGRGGFGGGFGGGGGGNTITITLTLPNIGRPVPLFFGGPVNDALGHGWGTGQISGNAGLVARISPPEGQERPGNFPGNYAVTGWTYSRAMDYLITDKDVDAQHVTIAGMSTGGKQVLYTAAMEERIWCVVPQSSGAMGVKLSRRDIGETVDNLATGSFAGNYCPNFKKYIGHWNDMPIDQHEMIALMAPRKMFITGGNQELWQDVKGGFLAAVAAEPVYNLLGKRGVAAVDLPPIEQPIVFGEIGFYHHNGGHTYTANERTWVTAWMEKLLPTVTPGQ
jgi:hypothetical protein